MSKMKIGIVGTGNVGAACAFAAVTRGSAREIVLVNRTRKTAEPRPRGDMGTERDRGRAL